MEVAKPNNGYSIGQINTNDKNGEQKYLVEQ
jgi:hypothetical protein